MTTVQYLLLTSNLFMMTGFVCAALKAEREAIVSYVMALTWGVLAVLSTLSQP